MLAIKVSPFRFQALNNPTNHTRFRQAKRNFSNLSGKSPEVCELNKVEDLFKKWFEFKSTRPVYDKFQDSFYGYSEKHPHGIGFRGIPNIDYRLIPSVFRNQGTELEDKSIIQSIQDSTRSYSSPVFEQNLYHSFRLRITEPIKDHNLIFDWLALMQHYGAPTRLLDWSESILTALYFAVEPLPENQDKDGAIWVLNAYRLNKLTTISHIPGIGISSSLNTAARAEMVTSLDLRTILKNKNLLNIHSFDVPPDGSIEEIFGRVLRKERHVLKNMDQEGFIKRIHSPYAAYASRLNERIKLQNGFFTIFGGKSTDATSLKPNSEPYIDKEWALKKFHSLEELNDQQPENDKFLFKFCVVPAKSKVSICKQLFELGVHRGSVYGDITNMSKYLIERTTPHILK